MTCSRNIPRLLLGAVLILLLWSADLTVARPAHCACPWPSSHAATLRLRMPLDQPDKERLFREDGLHGDRSHIPQMIDLLDTKTHPDLLKTILLSLARLGATQALPAMDALMQQEGSKHDHDMVWFVQAARVRLVAQTSPTPQQQVRRFFQLWGQSPAELTKAAAAHTPDIRKGNNLPYSVESDVIDELADMIYRGSQSGSYQAYLAEPSVAQVDFSQAIRPFASMKIKLAPLTPAQQREWLVNSLKHEDFMNMVELQLLLDLGRSEAGDLAVHQLQEMDRNRDKYMAAQFTSFFILLYASGDHYQSALWKHFQQEAKEDPKIKEGLRFYPEDNFFFGV